MNSSKEVKITRTETERGRGGGEGEGREREGGTGKRREERVSHHWLKTSFAFKKKIDFCVHPHHSASAQSKSSS